MLYNSHHVASNKAAAEPQRESALAPGTDGKKVNKHRSVHFSSDSKAEVKSVMFQHSRMHATGLHVMTCVFAVQRTGFWSRFKYAISHGKGKALALIPA